VSQIIEEFLRVGIYKRTQGLIVRQVTGFTLVAALLIGLWRLMLMLLTYETLPRGICYGVPAFLAVVCIWVSYRAVNLPAFADFLIAVEAEMNKVSWPSWTELSRWSAVVIVMIFALGFLLAAFDFFWVWFFKLIGVLKSF
jgi:preprotein translocase subunit SecE